jgi:hypothetical protein
MKENNNPLVDKKVEDLLRPRYKVIADYPNSTLSVDEIIEQIEVEEGQFLFNMGFSHNYPHLFKKLEWWEERKESEMLKYVKNAVDGYIFELMKQSKHTPSLVPVMKLYK